VKLESYREPRQARKDRLELWATSLESMASRWDAYRLSEEAAHREPKWIDDEALTSAVGEAIKAVDEPLLLERIKAWESAWKEVIS
jgi:hypothetical protein